jgi:hypothetical protein
MVELSQLFEHGYLPEKLRGNPHPLFIIEIYDFKSCQDSRLFIFHPVDLSVSSLSYKFEFVAFQTFKRLFVTISIRVLRIRVDRKV